MQTSLDIVKHAVEVSFKYESTQADRSAALQTFDQACYHAAAAFVHIAL